jgi:hypothetical protein
MDKPRHDRNSKTYLTKVRPFEYATLNSLLEENLPFNHHLVVAAPFLQEIPNPDWVAGTAANLASRYQAESIFIWLHCEEAVAKARIFERSAIRDLSKMHDWEAYASAIVEPPRDQPGVLCLDSSKPDFVEQIVHKVLPLWKPT